MRKWLVIGAATALVALAVAVLWPRESSSLAPVAAAAGSSAARVLPDFAPVEVSSGSSEGLTLTGRVLDAAGRPVAGADVFLAASAQKTLTSVRCDECGLALLACPARESGPHALAFFEQARGFLQPKATARTDAQGRFRFEHLAGVSFSVWARAAGFGAAMHERAAPGEPVDLYLPPLRSIGGQVVDDSGQPVAGARVHAVSRKVPLPSEAVTGKDGTFTLPELGEGPFYLLATAEGFLPSVEPQVEAGPRLVRLRLEPSRTLEVRVTRQGAPAEATVRLKADHLAREARAEGGVVRFEGLYPDELVVTAEAGKLGSVPRTLSLSERLTQVTLELEDAGTLLVTVVDETGEPVPSPELVLRSVRGQPIQSQKPSTGALVQFGPLAVGDYVLEGHAEGFRDAELPARVKPGETTLELELARATLISGQVLDQYGRPAPNVSVLVQPTGDTVLADAEGRFSAPVPTPGLYELHAHHSEWGGGLAKATAPAEGVKLELEPGAAVEVTVLTEGRRVEGADVMLWLENEGVFRSDNPSGSDGLVPMRGLPPGTYSMVATHPDYLPSEPQKVTVADGQTQRVTVSLAQGASIRGEVVDARGAPVAGASVSVLPRLAEPVTSDAQGHFEVRALKPGRPFLLEARHPGYDQRERVQASAGEDSVKLVMEARGLFRGRVVSSDGAPVRRFRLDEHDVSSTDGRFEVALPLAGDRVIVSVEAAGFEPLMVDKPARPELGDLVLERAPTVTGRVRDEGGGPVADAVVSCDACEDSVMTGPDGHFVLPSPPFVAKFNVSARKGKLSASAPASREGTPTPVELVLKPATRLYGTVYQEDGRPAAGFPLEGVNSDRGEPLSIVTGPDGRYSVDVSPGHYRFALGQMREFSGEPALLVQVAGGEQRLDLGPAPGTASLTVQLKPAQGRALWVLSGDLGGVGNLPKELMRTRYGQLLYQPRGERVTLQGLPPGRYTLVWGHFHVDTEEGPVVRTVDVPSSADVVLTP
jgi:protocatechuate 3,4-dioxygenase beta subunit